MIKVKYDAELSWQREITISRTHNFLFIPLINLNHFWNSDGIYHYIHWLGFVLSFTTKQLWFPGLFQIKKLIYNNRVKLYVQPAYGYANRYLSIHIYLHIRYGRKYEVYKCQIL